MIDGREPIYVATSTDRKYLPYTAAMVHSLARSRHPATRIELTIMHVGVPQADRQKVEHAAGGVAIQWVLIDVDRYRRWGLPIDPVVLTPHYFRCVLAHVYPASTQRVIYLDADTLVVDDLTPLWHWPLARRPLAAAGDLMSVVRDAIGHWHEIGLDGDAPYFNSGVLVIDLAQWREERIGERVMRQCQADRHRLLIRNRWPQHDQYGFNVVLQHRWARLDERWNHFPERRSARPGIVHFLGDTKPGAPRTRPEFTRMFTTAIDATAWAGWRPPATAQ
ncbi:MAG TPA: glycosyltransferase family 8 protein [Candidatus Limnocylindrales bacterium]